MPTRDRQTTSEKPSDKFARSEQATPRGRREVNRTSDVDTDDIVQDASEDSFPASDPPAYTGGQAHMGGEGKEGE